MSDVRTTDNFDPDKDGKPRLPRTPVALVARSFSALFLMLSSAHPADALTWLKSMVARRKPLSMALPWLTFDAIRALDARVPRDARVFEFGAGHSTLWWARRGNAVNSVEDDRGWYECVAKALVPHGKCRAWYEPVADDYVARAARVASDFDVVVVDGSERKRCIAAALPLVRPGGLLVVDNTDWHWFRQGRGLVPESWNRDVFPGFAPFIGHPSETTLWTRPSSD